MGFYGSSFCGVTPFCILVIYRLIKAIQNKRKTGDFIDYENSSLWKLSDSSELTRSSASRGDDFNSFDSESYSFNWQNFRTLVFFIGLPALGGFFFVFYAFKFALLADINQGCVPSLFAVTNIYIAIVFYFCFNEPLTCTQITGIALIVACIILLAMDEKEDSVDQERSIVLTAEQKHVYGVFAILCAVGAPFLWTLRSY